MIQWATGNTGRLAVQSVAQRPELQLVGVREERDAHLSEPVIDPRVVDDLAHEEDAAIGKLPACLVRVVDGAIDAVAEPEFSGEADGQAAGCQRVPDAFRPRTSSE